MTVQELTDKLALNVLTRGSGMDKVVTGGYASDLLSNVMGQAADGNVLITMQGHQNIVAVAALVGLAAIIIAGGVQPDAKTIEKAGCEDVVLLTTSQPVYDIIGQMYTLGIRGKNASAGC